MKKYSKLLLSLIVSKLVAGPISNDSLASRNRASSVKSRQSNVNSLRETLMSVGTTVALKKGYEIASYGTIYDWAANAHAFESEQILYNLFGDKLSFLTQESISVILSVIQAKVKNLVEAHKKLNVSYAKVENLVDFYKDLGKLQYSLDDSEAVNRSSNIEDKSLVDDPKIKKELSVLDGKNKVVNLVKESKYLKLKFYLSDSKEVNKVNSVKIPLNAESFQVVYSGDVCELQFLSELNSKSSVSKLKIGIKKNDLKELLAFDVMPDSSELKAHGSDFVASKSEFTQNLFKKVCEYLEGSKQSNKKQNTHQNINVIKFMNKVINVSFRTILGNLVKLDGKIDDKKILRTLYLGFDQTLLPKSKLSYDNDLFEFDSYDKVKSRTYIDFNNVEAAPSFASVNRYTENILLMFFHEQESYTQKNKVLSGGQTLVDKKLEIKKIEQECSRKISNLQKENLALLNNSVVKSFFDNKENFHITQEALEKIMTGKRNLEVIKDKYKEIQKKQPNVHPNLPKAHKVEKTCCGC